MSFIHQLSGLGRLSLPYKGVGLGMGLLVLTGCSIASIPHIFSEAEKDRRISICENARVNMAAATDPVEIRRWQLLFEEYECRTQRELMTDGN